ILIIIIIIIILSFKSCNSRNKILESETEFFQAFVNANTDFACKIHKDETLLLQPEIAETTLNEMYAKWYLPVDDDATMIDILKKYENNKEATALISKNSAGCRNGGDPIYYETEVNEN
ncbi:MAG: hypothetical protein O3B47_04195, partial [bacterium]|nr:hypothetical protein [bacterium]